MREKHLSNKYWAEVVSCATYIMKRCPSKSVKIMIPKKAWSGRKHSVSHMRVFRCVAYAHVLDQLRRKLDNKGEKCILLVIVMNKRHISYTNQIEKRS